MNQMQQEPQAVPVDLDFSKDVENLTQGKAKSLLRRFHVEVSNTLKKNFSHLNAQIKVIEEKLDKKYGGMYKILIHKFLNQQEEKIYNLEIFCVAMEKVITDHIYSVVQTTDSKEEFMKKYKAEFSKILIETKKEVDEKYKGKASNVPEEENSEKVPEAGQEQL